MNVLFIGSGCWLPGWLLPHTPLRLQRTATPRSFTTRTPWCPQLHSLPGSSTVPRTTLPHLVTDLRYGSAPHCVWVYTRCRGCVCTRYGSLHWLRLDHAAVIPPLHVLPDFGLVRCTLVTFTAFATFSRGFGSRSRRTHGSRYGYTLLHWVYCLPLHLFLFTHGALQCRFSTRLHTHGLHGCSSTHGCCPGYAFGLQRYALVCYTLLVPAGLVHLRCGCGTFGSTIAAATFTG